jgi:hypothetical protein
MEVVMHVRRSRLALGFLLPLLFSAAFSSALASDQPARRSGWEELSALSPGTAILVTLDDGRRLERYFALATADQLVTLNLSDVSSRARRDEVLKLLRAAPQRTAGAMIYAEDRGRDIPIVQRFQRTAVVSVELPRPFAFEVPGPLGWLLNVGGPCPDCDAAQTWVGRKPTPLPSPATAGRSAVVYLAPSAAPNPLDAVAWDQLRMLLPAGLRTKQPSS